MKKAINILFLLLGIQFINAQEQQHKVRSGETVYAIAKKYKVKEKEIFEANPSIKDKPLAIGKILVIPSKKKQEPKTEAVVIPQTHTVAKGESFYSIAQKYQLKLSDLQQNNPDLDAKDLKIGQEIFLNKQRVEESPKVVVEETANEVEDDTQAEDLIHVVKKGETLYKIAKKYQTTVQNIKDLNPSMKKILPTNYQLVIKKGIPIDNEVVEVVAVSEDEISEVAEISTSALSKADLLIEKASEYLGTRYRSGGTTAAGFDCSGLMCTTFEEIDFNLPRTSGSQAAMGSKVKKRQAQKGDLIFFATNRKKTISHVGMITEVDGDEIKFIHSSTSSGVIISSIREPYYAKRFVQINRVLN
jgi:cell wall-associated NlpC family hydrolase